MAGLRFAESSTMEARPHRAGRLLIDRMDTQVQRPEFPQAPKPAWGSTKAPAQDDQAMDAHHYQPPLRLQRWFAR